MKSKNNQQLLKIGEVAAMNHISTDALRYYDKVGLFKPEFVDSNGYRYYSVHQLLDLDLIIWLRMNGAHVKEICQIMESKSLDKVVEILSEENSRLQGQIKKLQDQLYANRYYISHMKKCMEWEMNECYLLEFESRFYISSKKPVFPSDRDAYELGLKDIMQDIVDKDHYFNSFFGGIYRYSDTKECYEELFYPAVVNIRNQRDSISRPIPKGIYGVMPVNGYFNNAYDMIPKLKSFIQEQGFITNGDCYVLKMWERGNTSLGEMLELQIPILKNPLSKR